MDALPAPEARLVAGLPIRVLVVEEARDASLRVAGEVERLVRAGGDGGAGAVLGLATGHTPLGLYAELARRHREEGLTFARARSFNLDEYLGLPADSPASFRAFMRRHLLAHVDLAPERAHIPPCDLELAAAPAWCAGYERELREAGGVDLQVLGIGRNGHLAFNEPGSPRDSRTRVVELSADTRAANRPDFPSGVAVPARALTMGVATILAARRLRVLAFGAHKAEVVRRTLHDRVGPELPATFLREHPDVELWLDRAAASLLSGT